MGTEKTPRVCLVTGGNRGLGLGVCRVLAEQGHRVILTARDPHKGEPIAKAMRATGLDVTFVAVDVADAASVHALADEVKGAFGGVDILVNNAGILPDQGSGMSVFDAPEERIRLALETNYFGALRLVRAFVPGMVARRWGRVVNVSSGMGQLTEMNGHYPAYRTSKAAMNVLTRIVADETQGAGVLINSVCPGWVKTDMGGANATRELDEGIKGIVWAATLPDDGPTGGFFRDGKKIAW